MTLEEFTAQLNHTTFWKEFTFPETKFSPRPTVEVELADGIVKIGSLALIFQLKERTEATPDPQAERQWFRRKVLGKATSQIKASIRYLRENDEIRLTNSRGHEITIKNSDIQDIKKIIIFLSGTALPEDCTKIKYHISATEGFIHIIDSNDYLNILEKLRVPDDVRLYLDYRELTLPKLRETETVVDESDIIFAFLSDNNLPEPNSADKLRLFIQDFDAFDLSDLMRNLERHIVHSGAETDYYRIMEEFARVPRSVWREFKKRLIISLKSSKAKESGRRFRFGFPKTDCTFMVASIDPDWQVAGADGTIMRINSLSMFTEAAKYELRTRFAVGLIISRDGDFFQLDWCFIDDDWRPDARMEELLATTPLFGPAREGLVDSFFFRVPDPEAGA